MDTITEKKFKEFITFLNTYNNDNDHIINLNELARGHVAKKICDLSLEDKQEIFKNYLPESIITDESIIFDYKNKSISVSINNINTLSFNIITNW